jgi:hypothetical protein
MPKTVAVVIICFSSKLNVIRSFAGDRLCGDTAYFWLREFSMPMQLTLGIERRAFSFTLDRLESSR